MAASFGLERTVHITDLARKILKGLPPVRFLVEVTDNYLIFLPQSNVSTIKEAALGTLQAWHIPIASEPEANHFPLLLMRIFVGKSRNEILLEGDISLYDEVLLARDQSVKSNFLLGTVERRSTDLSGGVSRFAMKVAYDFAEKYSEAQRSDSASTTDINSTEL